MKQTTIIEPMYIAYMICSMIAKPLKEQFVYRKVCVHKFNTTFCDMLSSTKNETYKVDQNALQKETAQWDIYYNVIILVPSVISTMVFAILIDKISRKKVLILPIVGATLCATALLLNAYFMEWPVKFVLVAAALDGVCGQSLTVIAATSSYVADVTSLETRTKRIVILESTRFVSGLAAYSGGGIMIEKIGFVGTYSVIIGLYILQLIYWIFLKETKIQINNDCDAMKKTKCQLLLEPFQVVLKKRGNGKRGLLFIWATCFFLDSILSAGAGAVKTLYLLRPEINLSPSKIGYIYTERCALQFIGACVMNYVFLHKLKWLEARVMIIFFVCMIAEYILLAVADTLWKVVVANLTAIGMGVGSGTLRGRLSKLVESDEQGKLFAFFACVETLLSFGSTIAFREIYKDTVDYSASIIFYVVAGLALVPLVFMLALSFGYCNKKNYKELKEEETDCDNSIQRQPINS